MKTKTIPNDVTCFIQTHINRKKIELNKATEEKEKRIKARLAWEKRTRVEREKILKSAKINLLCLNKLVKEDTLKSYLDLEEAIAFPLWEPHFGHDRAYIFLKSDGVYAKTDHCQETKQDLKKITSSSITKDVFNRTNLSDLPDYIRSLERWNEENFVAYLRQQFTPI